MKTFTIEQQFIDKDESRLVYREQGDGPDRVFTGDLPHFTRAVSLGALTHWDDGTAIGDEQRRALIDRVSAYVFAHGYTSVCDASGALRFARGSYEITVSFSARPAIAWYSEIGRSTCVIGRAVGGDDSRRAHLYPAQTTRWTSGAPLTEEDRVTLATRLAADPRIDLEDPRRPSDPWALAIELWDWRWCVHAIVPPPPASWTDPSDARPPADTLFWRAELPAICRGGHIGSSYDGKRSHLGLARIAPGAGTRIRDWLFAEDLPVAPPDPDGGPAETRLQLWAWKTRPPPPDVADRVLGVVVEARLPQATPAFALYADGRARYLDSDCLIAWELPEVEFARAWLALLQSGTAAARPGRARQHIEPGEVRVTLLTPSGPRTSAAPPAAFLDACGAFLGRMMDATVPLDLET
ncbi:MAG: hypothetical protein ACRELB_25820 [Polyangiaceae bacterium]